MDVGCIYSVEDFVSPDRALSSYASIPFGISCVAAALKQAGHNPKMLVFTPRMDVPTAVRTFMRDTPAKLFCLTAVTSQYHAIRNIARTIKDLAPTAHTLLGGHHATLNPERTIAEPCLDAICVGEGERAAVACASQIENNRVPDGINNLWISSGQSVQRNPQDPFIQDLDALPRIDRSMWDEWVSDRNGTVSVLVGRGCPNRCTYCSNHALAKISSGRYVRFRSPDSVIGELEEIVTKYSSVNNIYLEIETFQANLKYTYSMCDRLEEFVAGLGRPVTFGTNLVVTRKMVEDPTLIEKLRRAHFGYVKIGLESGSERIRNEILRRPRYSNEDLVAFCREARKAGIKVFLYVLVGIPGETPSDFADTIACVRRCEPHDVDLSIFYPYPGTDLHRMAMEMGTLKDRVVSPGTERKTAVLDLPGFSRRRIRREYVLFPYRVYRGRKPPHRIAPLVLRGYLGRSARAIQKGAVAGLTRSAGRPRRGRRCGPVSRRPVRPAQAATPRRYRCSGAQPR